MSNQRYEIVGLTYEQARDFVDREWSGFISNGHAFQNGELFVRPMGCQCTYCTSGPRSAEETSPVAGCWDCSASLFGKCDNHR